MEIRIWILSLPEHVKGAPGSQLIIEPPQALSFGSPQSLPFTALKP